MQSCHVALTFGVKHEKVAPTHSTITTQPTIIPRSASSKKHRPTRPTEDCHVEAGTDVTPVHPSALPRVDLPEFNAGQPRASTVPSAAGTGPCHGSRFAVDSSVLDGPAVRQAPRRHPVASPGGARNKIQGLESCSAATARWLPSPSIGRPCLVAGLGHWRHKTDTDLGRRTT